MHNQINVFEINKKKLFEEQTKNSFHNRYIEVFSYEIHKIVKMNSFDIFLLSFYNCPILMLYKIMDDNKIKLLENVIYYFNS